MTTKELLYVKTVADEHNISKAAKKLFMAQPSLSQSIQRIEESIGMPLFHRTTTGLTLTFAGERYYHMAVQVLKMYEDFQLEISDINNLKTGHIHIGITNHLGTLVLPRVLPAYKNICPHVEITIHEENTAALEQQLLAGKLDFAVMHAPPERSSLSALRYELLSRDPFILVLSPDHPLLQKAVFQEGYPYPVLDLKLLAREPFLMLHQTQRIRQITDEVLLRAGISRPQTLKLPSFLRPAEWESCLYQNSIPEFIPVSFSQHVSVSIRHTGPDGICALPPLATAFCPKQINCSSGF